MEKAQRRSFRILGLNSDFLPSLETKRGKASSREFERICKDPEHPCYKLLSDKVMNPYDLCDETIGSTKNLLVQDDIKTHL